MLKDYNAIVVNRGGLVEQIYMRPTIESAEAKFKEEVMRIYPDAREVDLQRGLTDGYFEWDSWSVCMVDPHDWDTEIKQVNDGIEEFKRTAPLPSEYPNEQLVAKLHVFSGLEYNDYFDLTEVEEAVAAYKKRIGLDSNVRLYVDLSHEDGSCVMEDCILSHP